MKKEAINTFGEGLVMDLNPLTTPNNVLTNALNGTLITYNGNEFVLQNDMGNGEVHTAYLDKGYVPVGMKEHGGVIYVAAHNPISGKSQIGSFPSPQQLYEGEDLNVTPIQFNFSNFVEMRGSVPYIKLEYYKQKLFQVNNSEEVKIFHPGDRFVIVCNQIDNEIKQAIDAGVIKLRLGVINSSGTIDYIDDKSLRLYTNGLWIYENSNTPMLDVIRSKDLIQVFSAKSSGSLILILELKTFDTFNLVRKYSCNESNVISVEFSGETTGVFSGTSKNNPDEVGLIEDSNSTVQSTIVKSGKTGKQSYKIAPICPYGVLERMSKSGTIDFDAIRTNSEALGEWRFYVTDTYVKIGWGYDYYNLNENSDIEKIDFTFISITESNKANDAGNLNGSYKYTISKEYYNGSFEEIIPFDSGILKNWTYIVRIDRYVAGIKTIIGYKLLYTGSYFNDVFEETSDFDTLPAGAARTKKALSLKNEIQNTLTNSSITTEAKLNDSTVFVNKPQLRPTDFIATVSSIDTVVDYTYDTRQVGAYNFTVTPSIKYNFDDRLYAGKPNPTIVDNFLGNNPQATFDTPDNGGMTFSSDIPALTAQIKTITPPNPTIAYDRAKKVFSGNIHTHRNIIATNGPVKAITSEVEKLMPIYSPTMTPTDRNKLFAFREENSTLYCLTGDENNICYNTSVIGLNTVPGPKTGGTDEDGLRNGLLNMGNGTIGIMGGHSGGRACWGVQHASHRRGTAWHTTTDDGCAQVDHEDNFLIATWKDSNNNAWLINLASRKTETSDLTSTGLIRVEKMLKCFLSQMLVVKKGSIRTYFVGVDDSNLVYHNPFNTTCKINVMADKAGQTLDVDFFLDGNSESIESHMNKWTAAIPSIVNFLPIFNVNIPTSLTTTVEYGNNLRIGSDANILNCYASAYSYFSPPSIAEITNEVRSKIFIGVPQGSSVNGDGSINLKVKADGTFETRPSPTSFVDWTPQANTINLGYNINDRFINAYALNNISGPIQEDFYNEVFFRNTGNTHKALWLDGKNSDAPDMAVNIGFGSKSIYNY